MRDSQDEGQVDPATRKHRFDGAVHRLAVEVGDDTHDLHAPYVTPTDSLRAGYTNLTLADVAVSADHLLEIWLLKGDLSAAPFVLCAAATLVIALLTVGLQSVRAASASPVETLRHE